MKINGKKYSTIWFDNDNQTVNIINQALLPHQLQIVILSTYQDSIDAIKKMKVRGAPLIGCTGAFGVYLATKEFKNKNDLIKNCKKIIESRPTAVNLEWAVNRMLSKILSTDNNQWESIALIEAKNILKEDVCFCKSIGEYGYNIFKNIKKDNDTLNILTHCNAGWLATVDWGTATAPIYYAHKKNLDIHVWVDETRPRLQGAFLTSFELNNEKIKNTLISDNTGGFLMQRNKIDVCITGADRVMKNGDVINKIGTYEKAIAAFENNIPFYVAIPSSTLDFSDKKTEDIVIEERSSTEMSHVTGIINNELQISQIYPSESESLNIAFDITPSKFITGIITEHGVFDANESSLKNLITNLS